MGFRVFCLNKEREWYTGHTQLLSETRHDNESQSGSLSGDRNIDQVDLVLRKSNGTVRTSPDLPDHCL